MLVGALSDSKRDEVREAGATGERERKRERKGEKERERKKERERERERWHRRGMKTALVNGFLPDSFTRFLPFPPYRSISFSLSIPSFPHLLLFFHHPFPSPFLHRLCVPFFSKGRFLSRVLPRSPYVLASFLLRRQLFSRFQIASFLFPPIRGAFNQPNQQLAGRELLHV